MLSLPLLTGLGAAMIATSFLSGIFGMAGGMILMGILLSLLPLPTAMVLHAVAQMASNGWRAWLWRKHINRRIAGEYAAGALIALACWAAMRFVPEKPIAFIFLGLTPFLARLIPAAHAPNVARPGQGVVCGVVCIGLQLMTGVTGPLLDTFFVKSGLDRRGIVATKAINQVMGHALKLIYFGALVEGAGTVHPGIALFVVVTAMLGTTLSRRVLEAMSDAQFQAWTQRLITGVGLAYIGQGTWLILAAP